jgi:hypothetical protein
MSMKSVRLQRGIPFIKRGMRVFSNHSKRFGTITGTNDACNLNIRFDGDKRSQNCHPYFKLVYFDDNGNIIKEFE